METSTLIFFVGLVSIAAAASVPASSSGFGDDHYKELIQDLARDTAKLRSISNSTAPSTVAESRLHLVQSIDQDNRVLEQLAHGGGGLSSGSECLSVNKKIAKDIGDLLKLANVDLKCEGALTIVDGEDHYACVLQQEAKHLNKILTSANSTTSDSSSGQYQNLIVKLAKDITAINEVINSNDTSNKCQEASKELGKDLLAINQSIISA